jgi:hypothetical protein
MLIRVSSDRAGTAARGDGLIRDALIGDLTMDDRPDIDAEDIAEVVDETNLTEDGEDIANFDEMPRVLDVTSTIDDADEGDGDDDPELFDEGDRFEDDEEIAGDDSPRTGLEDRPDNAVTSADDDEDRPPIDELVTTEDRRKPSRFESANLSDDQLAELGYRRGR